MEAIVKAEQGEAAGGGEAGLNIKLETFYAKGYPDDADRIRYPRAMWESLSWGWLVRILAPYLISSPRCWSLEKEGEDTVFVLHVGPGDPVPPVEQMHFDVHSRVDVRQRGEKAFIHLTSTLTDAMERRVLLGRPDLNRSKLDGPPAPDRPGQDTEHEVEQV